MQDAFKSSLFGGILLPDVQRAQGESMTARIAASVGRVLRRAVPVAAAHDIHFHFDSVGRPYVCDHAKCESPGVRVDEA